MNKLGLYQDVFILYKELDGHGVTHAIIIKPPRRGQQTTIVLNHFIAAPQQLMCLNETPVMQCSLTPVTMFTAQVPNSNIKCKNAPGRLLLEDVAASTADIKEFLYDHRQCGSKG